jgi:hypothetical protein
MKRSLLAAAFLPLLCAAQLNKQTHWDSLFSRYIHLGDSCYADRSAARYYYGQALDVKYWSDAAQFRYDHAGRKFDEHVDRFFEYDDVGDYCRKDHCTNAAMRFFLNALYEARQSECRQLKHSRYYRHTKRKIRGLVRYEPHLKKYRWEFVPGFEEK